MSQVFDRNKLDRFLMLGHLTYLGKAPSFALFDKFVMKASRMI